MSQYILFPVSICMLPATNGGAVESGEGVTDRTATKPARLVTMLDDPRSDFRPSSSDDMVSIVPAHLFLL